MCDSESIGYSVLSKEPLFIGLKDGFFSEHLIFGSILGEYKKYIL